MDNEEAWSLTRSSYSFNVRVTAPIYDALLRILATGAYLNLTEYVNYLIRKDLEEKGIQLRTITVSRKADKEKEQKPLQDTVVVSTRIPILLKDALDRVLDTGLYFQPSDYLRDIIRQDLETRGNV
jgi:Arc/MetJ-type ribon-helix-helix transcriptional regulator